MSTSRAVTRAVTDAARDVRAALEAALAAIDQEADDRAAVAGAAQLADALRDVYEEAAAARARLIVAVVDNGAMTTSELAELLGLSKGRISQLYDAGGGRRDNRERQRSKATEPTTEPAESEGDEAG